MYHTILSRVLYRPLDGVTNPKYEVLCFLTTNFFGQKKVLAFNQWPVP
jgi:hypothetical protein